MWAKKKRYEEASLCFEYDKLKSSNIIEVLRLLQADDLIIELIGVGTNSSLLKNLQSWKTDYASRTRTTPEIDIDIIFAKRFNNKFTDMLDEIIENHPRILTLCSTNLSLGQFLHHANRKPLLVQAGVVACVVSIEFESNSFSVFFNTELFSQPEISQSLVKAFV